MDENFLQCFYKCNENTYYIKCSRFYEYYAWKITFSFPLRLSSINFMEHIHLVLMLLQLMFEIEKRAQIANHTPKSQFQFYFFKMYKPFNKLLDGVYLLLQYSVRHLNVSNFPIYKSIQEFNESN